MQNNKNTHHKEIIKWANFPDGTKIWARFKEGSITSWCVVDSVSWYNDYSYIVNDKFAEYRKAIIDGKVIEIRRKDCNTLIKTVDDIYDLVFDDERYLEDKTYTIINKAEPKDEFSIGDYVWHDGYLYYLGDKDDEYYYLYEGDNDDYTEKVRKNEELKKWKPQDSMGQYCWFLDDDSKTLTLWKLSEVDNENVSFKYKANNGVHHENIAPYLGFIPDALKDIK